MSCPRQIINCIELGVACPSHDWRNFRRQGDGITLWRILYRKDAWRCWLRIWSFHLLSVGYPSTHGWVAAPGLIFGVTLFQHLMRLSGLELTARTACRYIRDVTFCLAYLNSLMNPLLYSFLAYGFRNRFYKALQRVKRFIYNVRRRDTRKKPDSGSDGFWCFFEFKNCPSNLGWKQSQLRTRRQSVNVAGRSVLEYLW